MTKKHIVFIENEQSGAIRPARLNGRNLGSEVWRGKIFRYLRDVLELEEQDLHMLAKEMLCEITSKYDTAELLWFKMNQTQNIYLGPNDEKEERDMAKLKKMASKTKAPRAPRKTKTEGDGRGRPSELAGKKIYRKVEENPRRKGTHGHKSFEKIKSGGMLVSDYVAAGGRMVDLRWDIAHKFVEVK